MFDRNVSSYKSLISVGVLSVLLGVFSTACRATEASSDSSKTAVVVPAETSKGNKSSSATDASNEQTSEAELANIYVKDSTSSNPVTISAEAAGEESEIDFGDAYVRDNDPYPIPISAEAAGEESEIDFGDAYVRGDDSYPTSIRAEAVGEESGPLKDIDYDAPPIDDSYIAEEERREFFGTGTPIVTVPLADVRASLERGMPYGVARSHLLDNGWEPIVDLSIDTTYDASLRSLHEIGYLEAEACSGSGLGLCSMAFEGKDGIILGITLTTSSEVPNVWGWSVSTR